MCVIIETNNTHRLGGLMLKKFFPVLLILLATACSVATSSGERLEFNIVPTLKLAVTNNCYRSTVYVRTPQGAEVAVPYGNVVTVSIREYNPSNNNRNTVVTARGVGTDGLYLGSARKSVYLASGTSHDEWTISYLQDGERSCRAPGRYGLSEAVHDVLLAANEISDAIRDAVE
jgi:hypothetical protein